MAEPMTDSKRQKVRPRLTAVVTARLVDDYWDVNVEIDGETVGAGTSPDFPFDLADSILYGTTNDHLNGSQGVLGDALRELAESGR